MTFKDKEIQCTDCGTRFGFSAEEQSFYAGKGLDNEPRRCKQCRTERRNKSRGGHQGRPRAGLQESSQHGGGPFVRHSRHNSHGSAGRTPWTMEGREPRRAGIWQPRHGKSHHTEAPLYKASFGPRPHDRSVQGNGKDSRGQGSISGRQDRRELSPRDLHDAVCSDCNMATQVPFKPNGFSPVFCRNCFPRHRQQKLRLQRPDRGRQAPRHG